MHDPHRILRRDFTAHLDARDLFPGRPVLQSWIRENGWKGFAHKYHTPMHQHLAVPARMINLLVYFLNGNTPSGVKCSGKEAELRAATLLEYCRPRGLQSIDPRYHQDIVELISSTAVAPPTKPLDQTSEFITTLARNADAAHLAFREATDEELPTMIEWLAVEYGRQLAERPLSYATASREGFERRGTTPDAYLRSVRSWRGVSKLIFGVAMEATTPIGASVALPLSKRAYESVRLGALNTKDLTPDDLDETSQYLFLEAVVMKPRGTKARQKEATPALVASFFAQLALLSRVPDIATDPPLHLLSATFSDYSRTRLKGLGCSIIGSRHAHTEHELMERVIDIRRPNTPDAAIWGNWRALQHQLSIARGEEPAAPLPRRKQDTPHVKPVKRRKGRSGTTDE